MTKNQNAIQTLQQAVLYIMEYEQNLSVHDTQNGDTITPIDVVRKLTEYNKILVDMGIAGNQPMKKHIFATKDENADQEQEITKIHRRLKKWKKNPQQKNSQILQAYFDCKQKHKQVSEKDLYAHCVYKLEMKSFYINFNQMCNIAPKNHGKIFDIKDDGEVVLWQLVAAYIEEIWHQT